MRGWFFAPHHYRLLKAADTIGYLVLLWLTWRFIDGELHWKLAIGAVVLSGAWLGLTLLRINHLFKTYFDVLSRLEVAIPVAFGVVSRSSRSSLPATM